MEKINHIQLDTQRLLLRSFMRTDEEKYIKIMSNRNVTYYLGNRQEKSESQIRDILIYFEDIWKTYGYGVFAIIEKKSGELIGQCGYLPIKENGEIELLYALDEKAWSKGYALEAANAVLNYAWRNYSWENIVAMAYVQNKASIKTLINLGFEFKKKVNMYGGELMKYELDLAKYSKK